MQPARPPPGRPPDSCRRCQAALPEVRQERRLPRVHRLHSQIDLRVRLLRALLFGVGGGKYLAAIGRQELAVRPDGAREERLHPVVIPLGERLQLVVVAARALEGDTERGGDEDRLRVVEHPNLVLGELVRVEIIARGVHRRAQEAGRGQRLLDLRGPFCGGVVVDQARRLRFARAGSGRRAYRC